MRSLIMTIITAVSLSVWYCLAGMDKTIIMGIVIIVGAIYETKE